LIVAARLKGRSFSCTVSPKRVKGLQPVREFVFVSPRAIMPPTTTEGGVPRRLKPVVFPYASGTAEAVPLQNRQGGLAP